MRAIVAAASLALALTAREKPSDVYAGAIAKYVAGDSDAAFQALARVPHDDIQREIEMSIAAISRGGPAGPRRRLEAIAMLHTEYGLTEATNQKDVLFHVDMAHLSLAIARGSLAGKVPETDQPEMRRAREFLPRWYALATSVLLSSFSDQNAATLIDEGVRLFPEDQTVLFWHGMVREFSAVWVGARSLRPDDPARSPTLRINAGPGILAVARLWGPAEDAFRRVIQKDPNQFEAHLHLGYTLYSLQDYGAAKAEYELARDRSPDPFVVYMADLLLARLKEDQNHLKDAVQDYEHAIAKMPGAQNAYVGLASVEARLGDGIRARELTERLAATPEKQRVRDPWWAFHTTRVPVDDLRWLRQAVSR